MTVDGMHVAGSNGQPELPRLKLGGVDPSVIVHFVFLGVSRVRVWGIIMIDVSRLSEISRH